MKSLYKKLILSTLIITICYTSLFNCFGKFSLTRKFYQTIDGLKYGKGKVKRGIQTAVLYVCIYFYVVPITLAIDFVILNLLEYWMGKNLLGFNGYDKNGNYVKKFHKGNQRIVLRYSDFGSRLDLIMFDGKKIEEFVVLRSAPGVIFKEEKGDLKEITFSKKLVGQKMLFQTTKNGKLESSKVMNYKDFQEMKKILLKY